MYIREESKVKLYTTYLSHIDVYGCKILSMKKSDKEKLLRLERKVLGKIYGT